MSAFLSLISDLPHCMFFQDIDLGDSPILCLTMVGDKVWMGFEIGYICVYDTKTRHPVLQASNPFQLYAAMFGLILTPIYHVVCTLAHSINLQNVPMKWVITLPCSALESIVPMDIMCTSTFVL